MTGRGGCNFDACVVDSCFPKNGTRRHGHQFSFAGLLHVFEEFVNKLDRHRPFANGRRDAFDRA